jgi:UDP-N-acetyl-alpha-D-muramoyl-L-alanyl-L-glutamate epimerase
MRRSDNFSQFNRLRDEFPIFSYDAFDYEFTGASLEITFSFSLSDIRFRPKTVIPWKPEIFLPYENLSRPALDNLIFHMGMIELVSYWKATCSPLVLVRPFHLTDVQANFWKKLYYLGLGEFFYTNSIHTDKGSFMDLISEGDPVPPVFSYQPKEASIVPVGGGKDSAVTAGMLNDFKADWLPLVINEREATRQVIAAAGKSEQETITVIREIDPGLLELNSKGFLNGHTPFSAMLAFYSLLIAYISGRQEIILSNESSANEPTIPGTDINHQYSKSFEFEKDFREYYTRFISPDFNYFSLLRVFSELQIAGLFSGMTQYFEAFRSCNVGSKTNSWCGVCPKCLFTYIILSPFLEPEEVEKIFGANLLDDIDLRSILDELTGHADNKPFECIGTIDEVNVALASTLEKYQDKGLPSLLHYYSTLPVNKYRDADIIDYALRISKNHFVPDKYLGTPSRLFNYE